MMNVKEITENIYYVGVDDRTTQFFENLWPLPYGVSYNSYLVRGSEKTALIDTVLIDTVREFLSNIGGNTTIDYLVINHMEPDHSGSIPEVLELYPDMKIIGNAQTIGMVKGFYNVHDDSRFIQVKDGESISLGDMSLSFYTIPMVHWPETMATYVAGRKVLFSGDAFGTFGALNGGVIDVEMDSEIYIPEMYRYYSNIVGKYGKFVQAALKKLGGLEVEYICSTHGPVWHSRIAEVVDIYDRLSAYKSEPGVVIVYGSMYGNVAQAAGYIASELARLGVKNVKLHDAAHTPMSEIISDAFRYEGLVVGSATYSMRLFPPVEQFMNAMETREVKGKIFAAFSGYTWAKGPVIAAFEGYAQRMGMPMLASFAMKQSLNDDSRAEARALAATVAAALKA
ncbi:MAG: FprA family A-type flavoprotein [Candidatus Amulumruptor caecigallinarius]|nr:FprA family A-type flavoprotein [Candidatus Amulumruptor caecigallinarius]